MKLLHLAILAYLLFAIQVYAGFLAKETRDQVNTYQNEGERLRGRTLP